MHPLYKRADELTRTAIGAAIEVHRHKGTGLVEGIYEKCLLHELELRHIRAIHQPRLKIEYKGLVFEEQLRCNVMVEDCLLLELKSVAHVLPIHQAQLLNHMKLLNIPVGLIINFHESKVADGIVRLVLPGACQ